MQIDISTALIAQVAKEFYNSHVYLAASSLMENLGFTGFSAFFLKQSAEEREHGLSIFNYLMDRNVHCEIGEVPATGIKATIATDLPHTGGTPCQKAFAAFQLAQKAEQDNTKAISEIYFAALKARDFLTSTFLHALLGEQTEEEKWANDAIDRLTACGSNESAYLLVDQEFAERK